MRALYPTRLAAFARLAWLIGLSAHAALAKAADLTLTIEPISEPKGTVQVAVFASEQQFRKEAIRAVKVPATAGSMTVRLADLPAGDYAVTVFHDRNGNDKLDANFLGIPREPWGASIGNKSISGAPTWADARFALPAAGAAVRIRMND